LFSIVAGFLWFWFFFNFFLCSLYRKALTLLVPRESAPMDSGGSSIDLAVKQVGSWEGE